MKKFISIVLCLVLVFSFSIPSFASDIMPLAGDHNTELDALNEISYYVYWIFQDFTGFFNTANDWLSDIWQAITGDISRELTAIRGSLKNNDTDILSQVIDIASNSSNSLAQLLDINDFTRSSYDELKRIRENLFGETLYLQSFASVVSDNLLTLVSNENNLKSNVWLTDTGYQDSFYFHIANDLNSLKTREHFLWTSGESTIAWKSFKSSWYYQVYDNLEMLQQVLADEDDLALKESQKSNQEQAEEYFMSGNSTTTSIGGNDIFRIQDFTNVFIDFFGNSSVSGSSSSMSNATDSLNSYLTPNFSDLENYPFAWFILVDSDINRVSSTYSLRDPNRIVTSYYDDNLSKIDDIFGGFN